MVDTQLPGVRMECWLKSPWLARSYIHKQYSYRPGKKPSCWGCRYATSNGRKDSGLTPFTFISLTYSSGLSFRYNVYLPHGKEPKHMEEGPIRQPQGPPAQV
jgi:hypothetical protein